MRKVRLPKNIDARFEECSYDKNSTWIRMTVPPDDVKRVLRWFMFQTSKEVAFTRGLIPENKVETQHWEFKVRTALLQGDTLHLQEPPNWPVKIFT